MRIFLFSIIFTIFGTGGAWFFNVNIITPYFLKITASEERYIDNDLFHTFKLWAKEDNPNKAGLVVRFPSGVVRAYSHGGLNLKQKRPVASLSKAVTGLCIAGLIMDKKLKPDDRLSSILKDYFAVHGVPKDDKTQDITISHLLTHRSGLYGNNSVKNSAFYTALHQTVYSHGVNEKYFNKLVPVSLSQNLVSNPGSRYNYSNTNYLLLGVVIEQVTNERYEDYCAKRVLEPAGVSASIDPNGKILSSYAGWYLSPLDVIKIYSLFDPANGFLTEEMVGWNSSPDGKRIAPEAKSHYGLGAVVNKRFGGDWYLHRGKWDRNPTSNISAGSLARSYGTLAIYTDEGVGVFAAFEPSIDDNSSTKLRDWMMYSYERGLSNAHK